ncbi:MAG: pyrroloquinoline quinone biosynthesis protein PqqB [Acetobacteraceae bacterium]
MLNARPGLRAIILGSAAGGGVPQWNCRCRVCELARAADPRVKARTQVGVAASTDGVHWLLIGASPDLRQQIMQTAALAPQAGLRHSPIVGIAVINADVDGLAGLLALRESQPFRLYAAAPVHRVIRDNPIFGVLDPALVKAVDVAPGEATDCGHGLRLTLLPMPGKIPLYLEDRASTEPEPGPSFAALIEAGGRSLLVAPACAEITEPVRDMLRRIDTILFDGTLFTDDEMIVAGVGRKTGRRMGHVSMSGAGGSLSRLADLPCRRIFVHINNTNPVLIEGSAEQVAIIAAGFEIAHDGMEVYA